MTGTGQLVERDGVTRIGVLCSACADVVFVESDKDICSPYICSVCLQRTIKRLERRERAEARRLGHGSYAREEVGG